MVLDAVGQPIAIDIGNVTDGFLEASPHCPFRNTATCVVPDRDGTREWIGTYIEEHAAEIEDGINVVPFASFRF